MPKKNYLIRAISIFLMILVILAISLILRNSSPPSLIQLDKKILQGLEGGRTYLKVYLSNKTRESWSSQGKNPCFLSYHLLNSQNKIISFNNRRFSLPGKIEPGAANEMEFHIRNPLEPGDYFLQFDLVKEGLFWFK
ncbi:MAG: hypothetical protein ACOC57_02705, partial [Acidobacteriota bacterium]